jgi:hypothetical protein
MKRIAVYFYLVLISFIVISLYLTMFIWGFFALLFNIDPRDLVDHLTSHMDDLIWKYQIFG